MVYFFKPKYIHDFLSSILPPFIDNGSYVSQDAHMSENTATRPCEPITKDSMTNQIRSCESRFKSCDRPLSAFDSSLSFPSLSSRLLVCDGIARNTIIDYKEPKHRREPAIEFTVERNAQRGDASVRNGIPWPPTFDGFTSQTFFDAIGHVVTAADLLMLGLFRSRNPSATAKDWTWSFHTEDTISKPDHGHVIPDAGYIVYSMPAKANARYVKKGVLVACVPLWAFNSKDMNAMSSLAKAKSSGRDGGKQSADVIEAFVNQVSLSTWPFLA